MLRNWTTTWKIVLDDLIMVSWFWWTLSRRVNPKWVIFHSLISTDRQYMRNIVTIDPSWLTEAAPHFYRQRHPNSLPHWETLVQWWLPTRIRFQEPVHLPYGSGLASWSYFELKSTWIVRIIRIEAILLHQPGQTLNFTYTWKRQQHIEYYTSKSLAHGYHSILVCRLVFSLLAYVTLVHIHYIHELGGLLVVDKII